MQDFPTSLASFSKKGGVFSMFSPRRTSFLGRSFLTPLPTSFLVAAVYLKMLNGGPVTLLCGCAHVCSVMSDSLQPRGLQSTRLLCPRHSPGKSTGVGCSFLLQGIFPIQGSKAGLLPCRRFLYRLSHITFPVTLLTTYKY